MATTRDIILDAYIVSGIKGLAQDVEGEELAFGLKQLTKIIQDLNTQNLWSYSYVELTGNLTGGQDTYTIGPTGDIVGVRPFEITSFAVVSNKNYTPLSVLGNKDFFNLRRTEDLQGMPYVFRYQQDYPNGTIQVHPSPSEGYQYKIQAQILVTEFGINDVVELPAGYVGYLEYALADRLANLQRSPNPMLSEEAQKRLGNIKNQNRDMTTLRTYELPSTHSSQGSYNIRTDQVGGL